MYKITVEQLSYTPEKSYPDKETLYEQQIEILDIPKLVTYINATE